MRMYLIDDAAAHDERTEIVGFRADHFLGRIFLRAEHGDKGYYALLPFRKSTGKNYTTEKIK